MTTEPSTVDPLALADEIEKESYQAHAYMLWRGGAFSRDERNAIVAALRASAKPPVQTWRPSEAQIEAAAKWLCENVICYKWESHYEGRCAPYPAWKVGGIANAKKEDFRDAIREIVKIALSAGEAPGPSTLAADLRKMPTSLNDACRSLELAADEIARLRAEPSPQPCQPSEAQIKHMVDRFLCWRLPESFNPDGGVSFKKTYNEHMPFGPQKHEPVGTNLFDAAQADAMVRYIINGLPACPDSSPVGEALGPSTLAASKQQNRCQVCDWPLAESREKGCVPGDCSYRPEDGSQEFYRIMRRREALKKHAGASEGESPSVRGEPSPTSQQLFSPGDPELLLGALLKFGKSTDGAVERDLLAAIQSNKAELSRLRAVCDGQAKELNECEQIAGQVLGYPWFMDDQKNFPDATEADGVCIGEHVTGTIVAELAGEYKKLKTERAEMVKALERRADGFESRGDTIYNGKIVAEELRCHIRRAALPKEQAG